MGKIDLFKGQKYKTVRTANRFKRGYLKRSITSMGWGSGPRRKQGEQEKARRRRQIERGIISANQVIIPRQITF